MDRLYIPAIILHLSLVPKTFYCNDNKITEFEIIDSKNSSTAYVILYALIDLWVFDSQRVEVWLLPWRWYILSIPLIAGEECAPRPVGWTKCFPLMTFVPDQNLCVNIYLSIRMRVLVIGRIYTYTESVVQYWWSCTPSQSIGLFFFVSARFLCWKPLVFLRAYQLCLALW